ncbi:MAG TPA: NAD(P)-binding domain-containing protein [Steroidobacteraceae bacterium]|nr:NAD(P)-binding domain-containing protein [Steroidobacteraceae bacterium]
MTKIIPAATGNPIDVAIIGSGPYGLSLAAHLGPRGTPFRIFGIPMHSWRYRMPQGMHLKSDGFASDLYAPGSAFTLAQYCKERSLPYQDVGFPVPLEMFASYGMEFQRRFVPQVEETEITSLAPAADGFALKTANGATFKARKVVVAAGVSHFSYVPPRLAATLPAGSLTHSSAHRDVAAMRGRKVAIIGGGSSAVDLAALMHEAGVDVQVLARRNAIQFHAPPVEPRPFLDRLRNPRSGLGLGWRSRLCTDAPLLFHTLPQKLRLRIVQRHLGPSPGWFMREKVVGRVPVHVGVALTDSCVKGEQIKLRFRQQDGSDGALQVDHVVAATGYRVSLGRLPFLDRALRDALRSVDDTPLLSRHFESSVKGLFFVGLASANSFGPLTRFAYGAGFTAMRLTPALAA